MFETAMTTKSRKIYRFGSWRLDVADRLLYKNAGLKNADLVPLPPKVMDTLLLLAGSAGHVLPKEEMLRQIWPDTFVEDGTLTQYISLLKKALGEDGPWIENVPRRGYRFTAPVEEYFEEPEQPRAVTALPTLSVRSRRSWVVAVATISIDIASILAWRSYSQAAAIRSIAVLPFRNLSGNPDLDYISDGLTDELTHAFTMLPGLRVAARTSAFQIRGKNEDVRAIGKRLNVAGILEGSVRLEQNTIRVTAQLVNTRTGLHVWSETYDGSLDDLLSIQERIGIATARKLERELRPVRSSVTTKVFLRYLEGRFFLAKGRPETFRKAAERFEEVIEKSPGYARAHSGLADSYYRWALWESFPPGEAFAKARKEAERALTLDDTLAEAHASLANIKFQFDWDYAAAEREFRRSIALDPRRADTWHWFSHLLTALGRFAESETAIRRAIDLEPFDLPSQNHLGWCYYFAGDYDRAIEQHRKVLELDPVHGQTRLLLGRALVQRGIFGEAIEQLRRNLDLSNESPERLAALAQAYAASGALSDATEILGRLRALAERRYVAAYSIAIVYSAMGAKQEALGYLEKAAAERSARVVEVKYEPVFSNLRGEPAFEAIVRKVGL